MEVKKTELDIQLGKNIAKVRKALGYTQAQFADLIGSSQRAICSYEKATCAVPVSLLPTIAQALRIPVESLLNLSPLSDLDKIDRRTKRAVILKKIDVLEKLPEEDQEFVFGLIDSFDKKKTD